MAKQEEVKCTISGIPKTEIKQMIEHLYGACVWSKSHNKTVCYPTSEGEVILYKIDTQETTAGKD